MVRSVTAIPNSWYLLHFIVVIKFYDQGNVWRKDLFGFKVPEREKRDHHRREAWQQAGMATGMASSLNFNIQAASEQKIQNGASR